MRTTIVIDDGLTREALRASGLKTKRAVVEEGLRTRQAVHVSDWSVGSSSAE